FDGKSAFEPILGNITLELKTPLNILYANTQTINGNAQGEMILQLPPNKEVADKMVEYFKEKNLGAEEVNYVD
ncbi:MAG: NIL domain-containing protein, partial [Lachnospiraceae bacterium]|nr:NIL domain-containing protein [Lachnospiraceae bacterium]